MDSPDSRPVRRNSEEHHPASGMARRTPSVWLPLSILAGATALILLFDLDLRLQRLFFSEAGGWWLMDRWLLGELYNYGTWPAIGLAAAAALACVFALASLRLRHWLRPAIFLILVMGLGPGLLINGLLKTNFGRPRPCEVTEFGRYREFMPLLHPGQPGRGASFPSGHAAMGFYLMSPYFLLLARRRRLATLVLATGLLLGSLVGFSRVSAGDHFLGDILWSWGLVHLVGLSCYYLMRFNQVPRFAEKRKEIRISSGTAGPHDEVGAPARLEK